MVPLTQDAKVMGKAAMEKSLTPAVRARRRFKAGRPTKIKSISLSPLNAMARAADEYIKLQALMEKEMGEEFDPNDTQVGLVYSSEGTTHTAWLPSSREGIPAFGNQILALTPLQPVFLGIVFHQFDRQAKTAESQHTFWVIQLMAGPIAEEQLRNERDKARLLGS